MTDDNTPSLNIGNVSEGTTPTLYVDGQEVPATYDPTTGTLTPTSPLSEGPHQLAYTLTDAAGNESPLSNALPVTVDTNAPAKPAAPTSYGDNVGDVQSADTVLVSDGTAVKAVTLTATDVSNKFVTVTYNKPAHGQTLSVSAQIADSSGNTTATATDVAVIDESVATPFNGSFGNSTTIGVVPSGMTITQWSPDVMLPTENILPTNTTASPDGGAFYTAVDQGTSSEEMAQFVLSGLVAGEKYNMSFYQAVVGHVTAVGSSTLKWYDSGSWLFQVKNADNTWSDLGASDVMPGIGASNTISSTNWYQDAIAITATGTSMTIRLVPQWEGTLGGGTRVALDGVSVLHVPPTVAPVVLDLDRDGQIEYTQQLMDVNLDGQLDQSAWASSEDGVLVWDKFGTGEVKDLSQYAFTAFGGETDLQGLAAGFDSNADGVFDAKDAKFAEFGVCQDADGDGTADVGELRSLADVGIASIDLQSDGVARTPADGVTEAGRTEVMMTDGSSVLAADAAFSFQTLAVLDLTGVLKDGVADMADGKAELLKINLTDLLQLPTTADGQHVLQVNGDEVDAVELEGLLDGQPGTWSSTGAVTQNGHTYNVYQHSADPSLQVLIDQHIATSNVHSS